MKMSNFIANDKIYDYLKDLHCDYLKDPEFLEYFIKNKIGISLNKNTLYLPPEYEKNNYYGGLRMKQVPEEMAKLAAYLYTKKDMIKTYMEIGVERGGTFFFLDSYLRAVAPDFQGSLGFDIRNQVLNSRLDRYQKKHRNCAFIMKNTQNHQMHSTVDVCFIDGDHSYAGVKRDFYNFKDKAKIIILHDIVCNLKGIEVCKLWEEIKHKYKYYEFTAQKECKKTQLGIGVIDLT